MAYPGYVYQPKHPRQNLIAHDRHGIPDSPLYGTSPRRENAMNSPRRMALQEESIEAIRDRELKLTHGLIKPDHRVKNDNRSSYDLIGGLQSNIGLTDPEFDKIRQREIQRSWQASRHSYRPEDFMPPPPASPIKVNNHGVPASPLYRPGREVTSRQGNNQPNGYNHDPPGSPIKINHQGVPLSPLYRPGQRATSHLGQRFDGEGHNGHDQSQYRPSFFEKDVDNPQHEPAQHTMQERWEDNSSPHKFQRLEHANSPEPELRFSNESPRQVKSPVYRPGLGRGLTMLDPRTGSAVGSRRPGWLAPYNDEQDYHRGHSLRLSSENFNALDEFRDHKGNHVIKGFPPNCIRRGYGLSSDRGIRFQEAGSLSHRAKDDSSGDPRYGANVPGGLGLGGNRHGGALLFIKFPVGRGNIEVAGQAFLRAKTLDCGGRYLGMARRVYEFGYERSPDQALAVFHFPSMEKALLFFQSDSVLRQPDFPPPYGHAEMWMVCNAYLPDDMQLYNTFLLSEITLHSGKDRRDFFENFQVPFEKYLYKNGAMPFVICSYGPRDRQHIRRHCYQLDTIVTCHLFQGIDHINWFTNDDTYTKFRSLHNQAATEKCLLFKLSKDTGL